MALFFNCDYKGGIILILLCRYYLGFCAVIGAALCIVRSAESLLGVCPI